MKHCKGIVTAIRQHGVKLELNNGVAGFERDQLDGHIVVTTEDGQKIETDAVVLYKLRTGYS